MNEEYYVWENESDATAAMNYINNSGWFPVVGYNAETGEPQPDCQQTTQWQDTPTQRCDNKWVVHRIPQDILDFLGVSEEQRQAFLNTFKPSIEICDDVNEWFNKCRQMPD